MSGFWTPYRCVNNQSNRTCMFSVMVCRIVTVISAEMSQYSLSMYIDTVRSLYNDMNGQDKQSGQQGTCRQCGGLFIVIVRPPHTYSDWISVHRIFPRFTWHCTIFTDLLDIFKVRRSVCVACALEKIAKTHIYIQ